MMTYLEQPFRKFTNDLSKEQPREQKTTRVSRAVYDLSSPSPSYIFTKFFYNDEVLCL